MSSYFARIESTFFFQIQKYPDHKSALEGSSTEKHEYHSLYFHKLGTPQSDDVLVADFRSHPEYMWFVFCYIRVNIKEDYICLFFNICLPEAVPFVSLPFSIISISVTPFTQKNQLIIFCFVELSIMEICSIG